MKYCLYLYGHASKACCCCLNSLSSAHGYRSVPVYTFGENNQFQLFPVRGKTTVILGDPGAVIVGSGEKAGRKFSSTGERAPGYRLSPNYFQKFSGYRLLIGHKKCFVLLCLIGEQFFLSSFREFVHDGYCFNHGLSGSCTKEIPAVRNFHFDIKSPSDFKILSARKLKTLFQKYKLELTRGIHACIGHVLRKY